MTIDKAIEIIQLNLNTKCSKMPPDVKDTLHLALEALKRIRSLRLEPVDYAITILPGETGQ